MSFIRVGAMPMGRAMVSRFLDRIEPTRRSRVLVILLLSTWGGMGIGVLFSGALALVWFVGGLIVANLVGKPAAKVARSEGSDDDATTAGATSADSLEARQARVLARLKAESGEPPAEDADSDEVIAS
jgi:hypothetical protein